MAKKTKHCPPRDRNPLVHIARFRKAGAHQKTNKAQRKAYKQSFKKDIQRLPQAA